MQYGPGSLWKGVSAPCCSNQSGVTDGGAALPRPCFPRIPAWLTSGCGEPRFPSTHASAADLCFLTRCRLASQVEGPEREQGYSRITVYVVRLCGHTVSLPRSFVSQSRQGRPCLMGKGKEVLEEYLGLEIHLGRFLESPVFHSNDPYVISREQVTRTRLVLLLSFCVLRMEEKANRLVTPGTFRRVSLALLSSPLYCRA